MMGFNGSCPQQLRNMNEERPFSPQKVYGANGRSRHKRSMQQNGRSYPIHNHPNRACTQGQQNGRSRHKRSMQKTDVPATKGLWRKRPFSPQKVYTENGRSHHKRLMEKTAVPPAHTVQRKRPFPPQKSMQQTAVLITKGLCSKRPFLPQKVYGENGRSFTIHNSKRPFTDVDNLFASLISVSKCLHP
ncbi:MAG: hypothetical protein R6X34_23370 [Chloroflexota bacterium]